MNIQALIHNLIVDQTLLHVYSTYPIIHFANPAISISTVSSGAYCIYLSYLQDLIVINLQRDVQNLIAAIEHFPSELNNLTLQYNKALSDITVLQNRADEIKNDIDVQNIEYEFSKQKVVNINNKILIHKNNSSFYVHAGVTCITIVTALCIGDLTIYSQTSELRSKIPEVVDSIEFKFKLSLIKLNLNLNLVIKF